MGRFGGITQLRRSRVTAIVAASLMLAAVGGIAWAVGSITKGKGSQQATTYHVVLPLNGGEKEVTWVVGRATVRARVFSEEDESGCGSLFGGIWPSVRNNGPDPIILVPGESAPEVAAELLPPGEESIAGDPAIVGGIYCHPGGGQANPQGGIGSFGIVDEGGSSANGTFSWSFRFNAADQTGHFSFTLQLRG